MSSFQDSELILMKSSTRKSCGMQWFLHPIIAVCASLPLIASRSEALTWTAHDIPGARHRPKGRQSPGILCTPAVVGDDDRLSIRVAGSHGGDFAVTRPGSDSVLFLGVSDGDRVGVKRTPIADVALERIAKGVRVKDLLAWMSPHFRKVKVFTRPGMYLFEVSENIESEDPIVDHWCNIVYRPLQP